jgi:hypothetical protein
MKVLHPAFLMITAVALLLIGGIVLLIMEKKKG